MATFKDYMVELSPSWLRGPRGEAWMRALGDVKDSLVARAKQAVQARMPALATDDALAEIGVERQIPRSIGESRASYAGRLRGAWESWPWGGTPTGLLRALWYQGYTNVELVIANGRAYKLNNDFGVDVTSGSQLEFGTGLWSTFIVYFPNPLPSDWIANGVPASNSNEANAIRTTIQKWKPGFATLSSIVIYQSGLTWGYPYGTWGSGTVWGGSAISWSP